MDDLTRFCCLNPDCPDHGKRGHGSLTVTMRYGPNKARRLLRCSTGTARFSERKSPPCSTPACRPVRPCPSWATWPRGSAPGRRPG
jgi:hypothetical protein